MSEATGFRITALAAAGRRVQQVITVSTALLLRYGGSGSLLGIVEVPPERSLSEGALSAQRRRRALSRRLSEERSPEALTAAVRTAHSVAEGVRAAVTDSAPDLLLLPWSPRAGRDESDPLADLIDNPPCDIALIKQGRGSKAGRVLLPARGGPHATLALRLAQAIAEQEGAVLTLLHVVSPTWSAKRRAREEDIFQQVARHIWYGRTERVQVEAESIEAALVAQGAGHDLVVMGAAGRDDPSASLLGRLPTIMAQRLDAAVIVAKTHEPVTRQTFAAAVEEADISQVVDRWFAENTFHSHEFRAMAQLIRLKERQGRTISVALPTLNEEKTVGKILTTIKRDLVDRYPVIDELIVIDSESEDRTVEIVENLGIPVFQHPRVLSRYGSFRGKGEALWKSLFVTQGDIVVWVDSDITGFSSKFIYGLIGPLLTQPELGFVKGFYRRPLDLGGQRLATGGGRVTELTARPLINLFYPHLSGLVQPLAGEMAGRRDVLESVPFFTGYGVETGLLIDILDAFGLRAIAQCDLQERIHRNQSLLSLSRMAFAIVQVVMRRLGDRKRLHLMDELNTSMKMIHYSPDELFLEVKEIWETERPPIKTLPEYAERRGGRGMVNAGAAGAGEAK